MSWEVKTVAQLIKEGTVLHVQDGNHGSIHPKSSDYSDEGIYFIMANDFVNGNIDYKNAKKIPLELSEKLRIGFAKNDDVLLTHKGTIGNTAIVEGVNPYIMLTPQVTYYRLNKEKLLPKFLHAHFREPNFQERLHSISAQSTRPYIGITAQKNIKLTIPPLKTQKRIADILSAYDDLIENNLKRIKLLEEAAQNIYKEWFVHLRFPGHENTPINEETGLPEGWEEKPLGELTEIKKGKNITKSTIIDGNVPVVAGGLKPAYYHNSSNTINPVITVSASGANAGYVNMYLEDIWASDCSYIDSNLSDSVFFIHNLLLNQQELIFGMQRGAAQPHVYPKDLKRAEFIIPDKGLIQKFEEQVLPQYNMKRVLLNQIQKLKAARDILLPRLMNRTIEV